MIRTRRLRSLLFAVTLLASAGMLGAQAPDADRTLAREILAELVAFETTAGTGQTIPAAWAMAARLLEAGYPQDDVQVVGPDPSLGNLVVRLRGSGAARPILMMAHLDVVPAVADAWTTDPFALVETEGYYYGRGTSDNKGGAATLVANLIRWKREGWVPTRDLIAVITADEETTQDSIAWLVRERRDLVDAEFALNTDAGGGELRDGVPVTFAVQAAEKVYLSFKLTAVNSGGHSSVPRPDNAINELVRALARIADYTFPVELNEITSAFLDRTADTHPDEIAADIRAVAAGSPDLDAAERLSASSARLNATLRTTCVATQLAAGHAENALPREASATVNCRILPGLEPDEVEATLRRLVDDDGIMLERMQVAVPSPPSLLTPEITNMLNVLVDEMFPTARIIPVMATGATDGLYTRNGGIPTYGLSSIFSPADDVRAHGQDERVGVEIFHDAVEFWYRMVKRLASD